MALGARVLKTGIAITLSLFLCGLLHVTPPVIAAVAAIFAVQPSIYRSWRYVWEQLQTNVLGAALAMLGGMFFSNDPVAVGLVCILIIAVCLKFKMEETIGLTLVTVVAVMEASNDWIFALNRFILILIGIGSALLINILFLPPDPKKQFIRQVHSVFAQLSPLLRTMISNEMKEAVIRDEKQRMKESVKSLSDKYYLLEEDMKKLSRNKFGEFRHLVVYKQMLQTLQSGMEIFTSAEQHYFQAIRSKETDKWFDEHLEKLIKYHEYVLLKFEDKLKPDSFKEFTLEEDNERFMNLLIDRYAQHPEGRSRLSVAAAAIYNYGYHIGRLNKLVTHYHRAGEDKHTLASDR
jgi:uncharacterized membrane protein YgaE (UPF0421/DUF939 family)